LRSAAGAAAAAVSGAGGGDGVEVVPTPGYNAGLLQDMMAGRHAAHLRALFDRLPLLRDALLMLKVHPPLNPCSNGYSIKLTICITISFNEPQHWIYPCVEHQMRLYWNIVIRSICSVYLDLLQVFICFIIK
jgi:hypothetical protein